MVYDYIIFDFDGTLADNSEFLIQKLREIAKRDFNQEFTEKEIQEYKSLGASDLFKKLNVPLHKIPTIALEVQGYMKDNLGKFKLKSGMKETILKLNKNYKLGILSSNSHDVIKAFLTREGIATHFSFVQECSRIFGKTDCMKKLLKKLKTDKVVYVGDEIRDVEAMRTAKVPIISVTWGFNSKISLVDINPGRVVDSPEQLVEMIG